MRVADENQRSPRTRGQAVQPSRPRRPTGLAAALARSRSADPKAARSARGSGRPRAFAPPEPRMNLSDGSMLRRRYREPDISPTARPGRGCDVLAAELHGTTAMPGPLSNGVMGGCETGDSCRTPDRRGQPVQILRAGSAAENFSHRRADELRHRFYPSARTVSSLDSLVTAMQDSGRIGSPSTSPTRADPRADRPDGGPPGNFGKPRWPRRAGRRQPPGTRGCSCSCPEPVAASRRAQGTDLSPTRSARVSRCGKAPRRGCRVHRSQHRIARSTSARVPSSCGPPWTWRGLLGRRRPLRAHGDRERNCPHLGRGCPAPRLRISEPDRAPSAAIALAGAFRPLNSRRTILMELRSLRSSFCPFRDFPQVLPGS